MVIVAIADAEPPRWVQSYDAGYTDDNGAWAGGSEIMHLVSHKGKLYAANGYWLDYHWVIPPDGQKAVQPRSCDWTHSDGRWQVDLDMGQVQRVRPGIHERKHSQVGHVHSAMHPASRSPSRHELLVMSSGARFDGVRVRFLFGCGTTTSGKWHHVLVRHGSGGRWCSTRHGSLSGQSNGR